MAKKTENKTGTNASNTADKLVDRLSAWAKAFIMHKDILTKSIMKIQEHSKNSSFSCLTVFFTEKNKEYFIAPDLAKAKDRLIGLIKQQHDVAVVCLNTRKNIGFLLSKWAFFINFEGLSFVFVNLRFNTKFALKPHIHNKISGPNIKKGILSLAESAGIAN